MIIDCQINEYDNDLIDVKIKFEYKNYRIIIESSCRNRKENQKCMIRVFYFNNELTADFRAKGYELDYFTNLENLLKIKEEIDKIEEIRNENM